MAASFTVVGSETRVTMTWKSPTAKIQAALERAAKWLQHNGYGDAAGPSGDYEAVESYVNGLNNQQTLDLVYKTINDKILEWGHDWDVRYNEEHARLLALADTSSEFAEE